MWIGLAFALTRSCRSSLVAQQVSSVGEWNGQPPCALAGSRRRRSLVYIRGVPRRCLRVRGVDGIGPRYGPLATGLVTMLRDPLIAQARKEDR
jgi:hypothetical protein